MTAPYTASRSVGRPTTLVLTAIVLLCLALIGGTGVMKFQLDRAESVLAAPDAALASEQDMSGRLRRTLGYGGFIDSAQSFIASRDQATLADMKADIRDARAITDHLPEKVPTETRRDLQAIVASFQHVMDKAERATVDRSIEITSADLIPLYAALPTLEARVDNAAAVSRLAAQGQVKLWAMLLTIAAWASLIIAAAMAVSVYLSICERNSAPLRALAQSVRNMARGDMVTSIWGMERQDTIGELARAVDLARYNFAQLPDITLLGDDGPTRLRFDGHSKSMFDAMMQVIGRDSEKMVEKADGLADTVRRQEEALSLISSRVEAVLNSVEKRGLDGDQQIRRVTQSITGSAESLIHAQQHVAEQLGRFLPFMQERAQGIAEIAQLTGRQVAQALQNLTLTERGLRASADESDMAVKKIATTADELSSRLFGAVNLLQASGKVLAETTHETQSRLTEIVSVLRGPTGGEGFNRLMTPAPATLPQSQPVFDNGMLAKVMSTLELTQQKLESRVAEHAEAARIHIELLSVQSNGLLTQTSTAAQTLSSAADHLRSERSKFDNALADALTRLQTIGGENIKADIGDLRDRLHELDASVKLATAPTPVLIELSSHVTGGFKQTVAAFGTLRADIDALDRAIKAAAERSASASQLPGLLVDGFGETSMMLADVRRELTRLDGVIRDATQPSPLLLGLSGQLASGFNAASDGFTSINSDIRKLDQAMQQVVRQAEEPSALMQELRQANLGFERMATTLEALRQDFGQLAALADELRASNSISGDVKERWYQLAAQIEATRNDLAETIAREIGRLERQSTAALPNAAVDAAPVVDINHAQLQDTQRQMEQQTQILSELVTTLGVLDSHMQQLKSDIHTARG